jgi:hypothetical protein
VAYFSRLLIDISLLFPLGWFRAGERFTEAGQAGSEGEERVIMASFAEKVTNTQSAEFFARFGRLAGSEERAQRLLVTLLGDDWAMERALAAAGPCAAAPVAQGGGSVIDLDAAPFVPEGWSIVSHARGGQFTWDPDRARLFPAEGQKDGQCSIGTEIRAEVEAKRPLNANALDGLLANPGLIPETWKGKYVFFWGTIYRDSGGNLVVRCLYWAGDRWCWFYYWLDSRWYYGSDHRAVFGEI